jgi:hypothetical protein
MKAVAITEADTDLHRLTARGGRAPSPKRSEDRRDGFLVVLLTTRGARTGRTAAAGRQHRDGEGAELGPAVTDPLGQRVHGCNRSTDGSSNFAEAGTRTDVAQGEPSAPFPGGRSASCRRHLTLAIHVATRAGLTAASPRSRSAASAPTSIARWPPSGTAPWPGRASPMCSWTPPTARPGSAAA